MIVITTPRNYARLAIALVPLSAGLCVVTLLGSILRGVWETLGKTKKPMPKAPADNSGHILLYTILISLAVIIALHAATWAIYRPAKSPKNLLGLSPVGRKVFVLSAYPVGVVFGAILVFTN